MLFHSTDFLQLFAIAFALYWGLRRQQHRMIVLLLASLYFYARWSPWLVLLIIFTALFDYWIALRMDAAEEPRRRKRLMVISLSVSLGLLGFFKYTNFLVGVAWPGIHWLGAAELPPEFDIILPLGISFYTFETISYIVDVYKRRVPAERKLVDYALFLMFFPHLVAGPIVRPASFLPQLQVLRRFDWRRLELGVRLFLLGVVKKAVIADNLAVMVDPIFADPGAYGTAVLWAGTVGYAIQIYCDFSGYTDMAIGIAHAFGLKLPENFNLPYLSMNVSEFWRRWHISLSSWLRDYLYIPLGGNRGGGFATHRNLFLTMLLGGLWHGAAWTFVAWGAYHGLLLAIHRIIPWPAWLAHRALIPVRIATTFFFVCIGWVLFRAQTFSDAGLIIHRLLVPTDGEWLDATASASFFAIVAVVVLAHAVRRFVDVERVIRSWPAPITALVVAVGFYLSLLFSPDAGGAFIYFQF